MLIIILLIATLTFLVIYGVIPTLFYRIYNRYLRQQRLKKGIKNIYLTFDDGVDSKYTKELLELLKIHQIKATFFVVAEFAKNNSKITEQIKKEGHTIALHSLNHKNEIFQSPKNIKNDFLESLRLLSELDIETKFFRSPWGHFSIAGIKEIRRNNLKVILWNVIVGDWKANISSQKIANKLVSKTKEGDIICLHDGRGKNNAPKRTIEALKIVIPIWKSKGFTFATVEELYEI